MREKASGPAYTSECYLLPIDTLPIVMSQVGQVSFDAQVRTLPEMVTGPYQVALTLCQGTISDCQIFRASSAVVLDGERALRTLQSIGDILWKISLPELGEFGDAPGSVMASNWLDLVPHRMPAGVALQHLPQRIRHVLSLVDGSRNLLQIALLLHLPLEDVFQILRQADAEGWIDTCIPMEFEHS